MTARVQFSERRGALVAAMMLVAAALVAYANSFHGVFVFDDYAMILKNEALRSWQTAFVRSSRPLVNLTLHLNYRLHGDHVFGYHLVNFLVHVANTLLVFGVVRRAVAARGKAGADGLLAASAVALLWTVHPICTESVTYIVQRAESMVTLFYLLTLWCFLRGAGSGRQHAWDTAAIVCCALGMATKPIMATAPVAVLMFDSVLISGTARRALRRHRGLYAGLAGTWVILGLLLAAPHESVTSAGFGMAAVTPLRYLATQPGVLVHYMRLVAWPDRLCLDYGWPLASGVAPIMVPALVVGLGVALTIAGLCRRRLTGLAGALCILVLLPTSSLVPLSDPAAEHRMYLPLAALIAVAVGVAGSILARVAHGDGSRAARAIVMVALVGGAGVLAYRTQLRNREYASEERMWRSVAAVRPGNVRARLGVGTALLRKGRPAAADAWLSEALALMPDLESARRCDAVTQYAMLHNNLGIIRKLQGRRSVAEAHFREALEANPSSANARRNLESVLRQTSSQKESNPD